MNIQELINELSEQEVREGISKDIKMIQDYYFKWFSLTIGDQTIKCEYMSSMNNMSDPVSYKLFINNNETWYDKSIKQILYDLLEKHYTNYNRLLVYIKNNMTRLSLGDVKYRADEFEIIKNGFIDIISINSLYDYYDTKFSEEDFIKYWTKIKNEYSKHN